MQKTGNLKVIWIIRGIDYFQITFAGYSFFVTERNRGWKFFLNILSYKSFLINVH